MQFLEKPDPLATLQGEGHVHLVHKEVLTDDRPSDMPKQPT